MLESVYMLRRLRAHTPFLFAILLIFFGIFVGEYLHLYDRIVYFDKVLHTLGGVVAGWIGLALLQKDVVKESWWQQLLVITAIAALIGVFWEFAEYASNFSRHNYPLLYHYFHGGNLADTIGDLAADITGGFLLACWALYKERH